MNLQRGLQHILQKIPNPRVEISQLRYAPASERAVFVIALEAAVYQIAATFVGQNQLIATHLGATDIQLSLLSTIPTFLSFFVILAAGFLINKVRNKKAVIITALIFAAGLYLVVSISPFIKSWGLYLFLISVPIAMMPISIYSNTLTEFIYQAVPERKLSGCYMSRTRNLYFASLVAQLLTGTLLSRAVTVDAKLWVHQIFIWVGCALLLLQAWMVARIPLDPQTRQAAETPMTDSIKTILSQMVSSKKFMVFMGASTVYHFTANCDATTFFLGQYQYMQMNEAWLSYLVITSMLARLLVAGVWRKLNDKWGAGFTFMLGHVGQALISLTTATGVLLGTTIGPPVFLLLHSIVSLMLFPLSSNLMLNMGKVIPERNRTVYVYIHAALMAIPSALGPICGVKIYQLLGGDMRGLLLWYGIICLLRLGNSAVWYLWQKKYNPKPAKAEG